MEKTNIKLKRESFIRVNCIECKSYEYWIYGDLLDNGEPIFQGPITIQCKDCGKISRFTLTIEENKKGDN